MPLASEFSVERPVARYTSAWKIEGRKLTIVRELEIKQESVNASDKPELESLGNMIREDQQRPLTLRRIGHLDTKTWMPRVSATQLADYGLRAFQ